MKEYALLRDGEVTDMLLTGKTLAEVRESYPLCDVRLASEVPPEKLERYRYWRERP